MEKIKCRICRKESVPFAGTGSGPHYGVLRCGYCNAWIRWLGKDEAKSLGITSENKIPEQKPVQGELF